jgi:hypothetical protein
MKTEKIECSETSAYKIQTPGNSPEESIQHSEQGESLKTRIICVTAKKNPSFLTAKILCFNIKKNGPNTNGFLVT